MNNGFDEQGRPIHFLDPSASESDPGRIARRNAQRRAAGMGVLFVLAVGLAILVITLVIVHFRH